MHLHTKFGFIPIQRHEKKQVQPECLKGNWFKTADKAKKRRLSNIGKWHTTSDNLVKQSTFINQRKQSLPNSSQSSQPSEIPQLKVDALEKKWQGSGKDALKKARNTTLKWTNMSQQLKQGTTNKTIQEDRKTRVRNNLKRFIRAVVKAHRAAKLFGQIPQRSKGLLLPGASSPKAPVGFMARKVQVTIYTAIFLHEIFEFYCMKN